MKGCGMCSMLAIDRTGKGARFRCARYRHPVPDRWFAIDMARECEGFDEAEPARGRHKEER